MALYRLPIDKFEAAAVRHLKMEGDVDGKSESMLLIDGELHSTIKRCNEATLLVLESGLNSFCIDCVNNTSPEMTPMS
jgi:hypothetical protein